MILMKSVLLGCHEIKYKYIILYFKFYDNCLCTCKLISKKKNKDSYFVSCNSVSTLHSSCLLRIKNTLIFLVAFFPKVDKYDHIRVDRILGIPADKEIYSYCVTVQSGYFLLRYTFICNTSGKTRSEALPQCPF